MREKIKEKLNNNKIELMGMFIYILILQIAYRLIYKDNNAWIQNFDVNYNLIKTVFSYLIIVIVFVLNEKINSNFVKFYNKLFIILMLVPISIIYSVRDFSTFVYLMFIIEFFIMVYGYRLLCKINFRKYIEKVDFRKYIKKINITNVTYYIFWLITIFVIACCFKYNGFPKLTALNLYNVYNVREQFYLPKYVQYLYNFETEFIILFLMVISLYKKNYGRVVLAFFIQLLFFLWKADKMILFSCPLVFIVYIFISKLDYKKYIEKNIIWAIIYICIFTIILNLTITKMPLGLFVRRLLLVPANLKFVYVDFFTNNPKIGFVGTVMNSLLKQDNPYIDYAYPNKIADIYFNSPEMYSNTGFLVEGFARWGYIGFIIIPVIYIVIMKILDKGSRNMSFPLMVSMSIIPLMMLNDSFLIPLATFGAIGLLCITSLIFKIDKLDTKMISNYVKTKHRRK